MSLQDLITVTWGRDANAQVRSESIRTLDRNVRLLWRAIQELSGTEVREPSRRVVHTARALPALLTHQGTVRLVYDAGLGTLFTQTMTVLNHPQREEVLDALLMRVASVRRISSGQLTVAAALARQAAELLEHNPIRIGLEDAESAFELAAAVGLQEMFAVAHELLHYLEVADSAAFVSLRDEVLARLEFFKDHLLDDRELAYAHDVGAKRPEGYERHQAGVEPDSWWYAPRFEVSPARPTGPVAEGMWALFDRVLRDERLLTEVTCDVLAALACTIFAQRGNGWNPLLAAASSALSLATLGLVVDIDRRATGAESSDTDASGFGEWELRLVALRVLVADAAGEAVEDSDDRPTVAELADAMRRAVGLHDGVLRVRLGDYDTWPSDPDPETQPHAELLLQAGFLNLRPDPRGPAQREREERWWMEAALR